MKHELKTWPVPFKQIVDGEKTFELRKNDRDFRQGDTVFLREWDNVLNRYTGRNLTFLIGTVMAHPFCQFPGLEPGYCVFSLRVELQPRASAAHLRASAAARVQRHRLNKKLNRMEAAPQ